MIMEYASSLYSRGWAKPDFFLGKELRNNIIHFKKTESYEYEAKLFDPDLAG